MTPYAGEGVDVAFEDSMRLAKGIVAALQKHPSKGTAQLDPLDQAVAAYENDMWPRTEKVTRLTDELTRLWMFTPDTPRSVIPDMMSKHLRYHTPALVYPFASLAMRSYFHLMKLVKGPDATVEDLTHAALQREQGSGRP